VSKINVEVNCRSDYIQRNITTAAGDAMWVVTCNSPPSAAAHLCDFLRALFERDKRYTIPP
jgi:hypothetical protein